MPTLAVKDFTPSDDKYHRTQVPYLQDFVTRQLSAYPKARVFAEIDKALEGGTTSPLYIKLEKVNGVWGMMLNLAYRLIEYRDTLPSSHQEYIELNRVIGLLHQFWMNAYRFTPADGEALLQATTTWLERDDFEGEPTLALNVMAATYMMGHYMVIAKAQPPLLLRAMMSKIQPLIDGFAAITFSTPSDEGSHRHPSLTEKQYLSMLSKHPALSEQEALTLTPHNASMLIINELTVLDKSLEKQIDKKRAAYADIKTQLACLYDLLTFLEQHEADFTPALFWAHYDSETSLNTMMTALSLPDKISQAWIASYRSYHADGRVDGFLKGASYYWSGTSIDIKVVRQQLLDACHIYHERLTHNLSEQTDIRRELQYLNDYITAEPFVYPIFAVAEHIKVLINLAKHLDFDPSLVHAQLALRKKAILPVLQKRKNTHSVIEYLLTTRDELRHAEDLLRKQAIKLTAWLRALEDFNKGLNYPLFEDLGINIQQVDELYRELIRTMFTEIVSPKADKPALLMTEQLAELHHYHEAVISRLSRQRQHLDAKIRLLEKTSSELFLPLLVTYLANLEDDFLQKFSMTFTVLYSKVFSTLDILSVQEAATSRDFYQSVNISLSQRQVSRLWHGDKARVKDLSGSALMMFSGKTTVRQHETEGAAGSSHNNTPPSPH